jgi:hypothetical protein
MACAAPKHPEADGLSVSSSFAPTPIRHRVLHIRGAQRTKQICTRMIAGPETPTYLGWARLTWGLQSQCLGQLGRTASLTRRQRLNEKSPQQTALVTCPRLHACLSSGRGALDCELSIKSRQRDLSTIDLNRGLGAGGRLGFQRRHRLAIDRIGPDGYSVTRRAVL